MGISERKEREKQEMRKRILDAAMKMFLEDGYDKTSIRHIAEKIEYSPATIYLYFRDKDELLYEVQKEAFEKLTVAFRKEATSADPLVRLKEIAHSYINFGMNNLELYDLMFIIRAPMNVVEEHQVWDNGSDAFEYLLKCLVECMEEKLIRFNDLTVAALSVWSMSHGLVSLNVRCRLKVMQLGEKELMDYINKSIDEYMELIKI